MLIYGVNIRISNIEAIDFSMLNKIKHNVIEHIYMPNADFENYFSLMLYIRWLDNQ